jgi:hypothetical protein
MGFVCSDATHQADVNFSICCFFFVFFRVNDDDGDEDDGGGHAQKTISNTAKALFVL